MRVRDLRNVLETAPDDAEIVVSDVADKCINLKRNPMVVGNIVYLDSIQEFPEDWYDEEGLEKNWDYC